jgi:transcriptional regulator with XRE-family HTH domain
MGRLSDDIRAAVRACGLTPSEVAAAAGMTRQNLHQFLNGAGLSLPVLDRLADVLRLRVVAEGRFETQVVWKPTVNLQPRGEGETPHAFVTWDSQEVATVKDDAPATPQPEEPVLPKPVRERGRPRKREVPPMRIVEELAQAVGAEHQGPDSEVPPMRVVDLTKRRRGRPRKNP